MDTGACWDQRSLHPVSSDFRARSRTSVWLSWLTLQMAWAVGKEAFQVLYPPNVKEPNFLQKHLHAHAHSCIPSTAGLEDQAEVEFMLVTPAYNLGKGEPDNSLLRPATFSPITSQGGSGCPGYTVGSTVTWWARGTGKGRETVNEAETQKTTWTYRSVLPNSKPLLPGQGTTRELKVGACTRPPWASLTLPTPRGATHGATQAQQWFSGHSFEVNASGSMCRCEARGAGNPTCLRSWKRKGISAQMSLWLLSDCSALLDTLLLARGSDGFVRRTHEEGKIWSG